MVVGKWNCIWSSILCEMCSPFFEPRTLVLRGKTLTSCSASYLVYEAPLNWRPYTVGHLAWAQNHPWNEVWIHALIPIGMKLHEKFKQIGFNPLPASFEKFHSEIITTGRFIPFYFKTNFLTPSNSKGLPSVSKKHTS